MIVNEFDNGWARQYPLKQYEQQVVQSMIQPLKHSNERVVLINSVWYTDEYHQQVKTWLANHDWDRIVLVAMLDAAIPQPDWYTEFQRPVTGLGYYPGPGFVDFCALFVERYLRADVVPDLLNEQHIDCPYMCLMRKPHGHRKNLFFRLKNAGLLDHGLVSMGSEDGQPWRSLTNDTGSDDLAPNADIRHYGVPNDIVSLGHPSNWQRHFVNVVAETFYDINRNFFVSEKIYKPIVGCRPFVLFDPDGGRQWLTTHGFEPYARDFNDICDLDPFDPEHLVPFLSILCSQSASYWQSKFLQLREKILYNQNRFCSHVEEQKKTVAQGLNF